MIETPVGKINIVINEERKAYRCIPLDNISKGFQVHGRYQIIIKDIVSVETIECTLEELKERSDRNIETGEDLELLSLYYNNNNFKISIGVEGAIEGIHYSYLENGIKMQIDSEREIEELHINIAWIAMQNPEVEDIYTWLAADPTL